ncbi:MAG: hypothetical protein ABIH03_17380 [Pseudomonadota bacterium]
MSADKIRQQAERVSRALREGDWMVGDSIVDAIDRILREADFEEMFAKWYGSSPRDGGPAPGASFEENCKRAVIFGWQQAKGGE